MAFETFSQRGLKPPLFFLCFTVSFKSTYLLPARRLNCARAFTRSFTLSGGVLGPVISEWIPVVTDESRIIELSAMLCFLMPVCTPPPSFPTWLRQRGVHIGSPFSPHFSGLPQCPCLCVTFSLRPSVPPSLSVPVSFSVSFYPFCGKLTHKMWIPVPARIRRVLIVLCDRMESEWFLQKRGQFSIHRVTSYFTFLVSRQIRVIRAACAGVKNTAGIKDTNRCFVHSLTYC